MTKIALIALALAATASGAEAQESWEVVEFKNEWGEADGSGAFSSRTSSLRPLLPPYDDVEAVLIVACEAVGIRFTALALPYSRNDSHRITVRLDGKEERWGTIESTSGRSLITDRLEQHVNKLLAAQKVGIAVDWYRGQTAAFMFDMTGLADALAQIGETNGNPCWESIDRGGQPLASKTSGRQR